MRLLVRHNNLAKTQRRKVFYVKSNLAKANHFALILSPAKAGAYSKLSDLAPDSYRDCEIKRQRKTKNLLALAPSWQKKTAHISQIRSIRGPLK